MGPTPTRAHARRTPRAARWIARSLWAIAVAQVVVGLLLAVLNGLSPRRLVAEFTVAVVVAALAFTAVGVLIARRQPGNAVGWLCCAAGLGNGLFAWSGQYARYALVTRPGALPGGEVALWLNLWAWVPVEATVILFLPPLFPDGRLPSARWRPLPWLAALAIALFAAAMAFGPNTDSVLPERQNPFFLPGAQGALDLAGGAGSALILASLLGAVGAAAARYRRARDVERQQLKWVGFAAGLLVATYLATSTIFLSGLDRTGFTSGVLLALAFPCVPAATGIAILRHRLYDIDLLINRTLVYGALTTGVVGVYIFAVGYLGALFRASGTGGNLAISLLATGLVAVLVQPLRAWLQRRVNRLLYGERDEPYGVLARLGQRLEGAIEPGATLPVVVETVAQALKLPYVAIALRQGGECAVAAAHGLPRTGLLRLPLTYGGERIGELALAPRAPDEPFSAADRRLLAELARQAGVAAHAVLLTADLARSRQRIVAAREEARRRLGSDLHDGVGHRLAALVRQAETATNLLDHDPAAAKVLLADLTARTKEAIAEVRGLAHALHPPELELLGLADALRERARQDGHGLQVRVDAPAALPPLPVAVEAAAYYIAQEALTNAHRHAAARHCHVRLTLVDRAAAGGAALGDAHIPLLELEITDDGRGPSPGGRASGPGLGLASMRERAAELGGVCAVGPGPAGGTRVYARLPCDRA